MVKVLPRAAKPGSSHQAAFGVLLEESRTNLYLLPEQGVAAAVAALFAAGNGVFYLGTAFTS